MEKPMKLTVTCREIEINGKPQYDVDNDFVNLYPDEGDEIEFVAGPGASDYAIDFNQGTPFLGADGNPKSHFDVRPGKPDGATIDKTKPHGTYEYAVTPLPGAGALPQASGFDPGVNIKP
jgi:hypothetical protein